MNQEITYNWYYHGMIDSDKRKIEKAIKDKDFETFIFFYKKYNSMGIQYGQIYKEFDAFCPIVYFPNTAYVWENNEIKEEINILERENFNKITFSEYEHG